MGTKSQRWIVTGGAGFIGSHLIEGLLRRGEAVLAIDNLSTGKESNIEKVIAAVGSKHASSLEFLRGDITDESLLQKSLDQSDIILHHAALGSVPRSIADPLASTRANIDGFVTVIHTAMKKGIKRFIFASSSSVYGDDESLPKKEGREGAPLSPYAVTKRANEMYGAVYSSLHGMSVVGLRYFNIFGPRQDPEGAYAAVIPKWANALLGGEVCTINGDGSISRDFCYIENVINANLAAAALPPGTSGVFNIACGEGTTLTELYEMIRAEVSEITGRKIPEAKYVGPRAGDIQHSLADLSAAKRVLSYEPTVGIREGIKKTVRWFAEN